MTDWSQSGSKLGVFISYSRDDIAFADQLDAVLGLHGFTTALDRSGISGGEDWKEKLGALIRDTDTVVFVMSPSSTVSEVCGWEVAEAVRLGKRIIPIVCRPLGEANPPALLASRNYIYFCATLDSPDTGFGTGLVQLVAALQTDLVWLREHTRLLQRAVEWEAVGKPTIRLLSGVDVELAKTWIANRPKSPAPTALHIEFLHASEEHERAQAEAVRQNIEERERLARERETAAQQAVREAERAEAAARATEAANAQLAAAVQRQGEEQRKRYRTRNVAFALMVVVALLFGATYLIYLTFDAEKARQRERLALAEKQQVLSKQELESRYFVERAQRLIDSGDAVTGINLVLEDLEPDPKYSDPPPALLESHLALFSGLNENLERSILTSDAPVSVVAVAQNGRQLVAAGRAVEIFEPGANTPKRRLVHDGDVKSALFSKDGTLVVTAVDRKARIYDLVTEEARTLEHAELVVSMAFDPTQRLIATASRDDTVGVWSIASEHRLMELKHDADVVGVAWSRDSARLYTATSAGTITAWNLTSGVPLYKVPAGARLTGISINPDGTRLVTSGDGPGAAALWNTADGSRVATLARGRADRRRFGRPETTIAVFSPSDNLVVTTGSDLLTAVWETERGSLVYSTQDHTREVLGATFSADGSRLMTFSKDNTARIYTACDGRELAILRGHAEEIVSAQFGSDGCSVMTGSKDKTSRSWDLARRHSQTVIGEQVCTPGLVRRASESCLAEAAFRERNSGLFHAALSEDGKWVATGAIDGKTRVYDSETGARQVELPSLTQIVRSVAFDPTGTLLVTGQGGGGDGGGMMRVWNWRERKEIVANGIAHGGSVNSASFSPDGGRIVTASGDGLVQVFETRTGRLMRRIETGPDCEDRRCRLNAATWSPDGQHIATASHGKKACIWNVSGSAESASVLSKPLRCVEHKGAVFSVEWDAAGAQIVTASEDRTAIVWDAEDGTGIVTLFGEDFEMRSALFLGTGALQQVVTRNGDRSLRFWDLETAHPIGRVTHSQAFMSSLVMDKAGRRLLTAAIDGTARIWTMRSFDELAQVARSLVPRCLSPEQVKQYNLSDFPLPMWCKGKLYGDQLRGPQSRSEVARN